MLYKVGTRLWAPRSEGGGNGCEGVISGDFPPGITQKLVP